MRSSNHFASAFTWLDQLERGTIPNAENATSFRARVAECLAEIMRMQTSRTSAVYCHGGVIRMLLSILLDLPYSKTDSFQIDYASVTEVTIGPDRTRIELLNFAPWREPA